MFFSEPPGFGGDMGSFDTGDVDIVSTTAIDARDNAAVSGPVSGNRQRLALCFQQRHRLFHINVFARLGRPDGHERMPVIWRGDGNCIQRLIVQRPAHVGYANGVGLNLGHFPDLVYSLIDEALVRINYVYDLHVILFEPTIDMADSYR